MENLKGKRKKKKVKCPNPLFVKWLTQWRDDAAERGIKSQYTYSKALTSLKKYPLVFSSGKECKVLENVGDKICKMLDDKLAEHLSIHGSAVVPDDEEVDVAVSKKSIKPNVTKKSLMDSSSSDQSNRQPVHTISDDEEPMPQAAKRRRSHSSGDYVPAFRSGPYAILLTLYKNYQRVNSIEQMSKVSLIREAQSLCDASFNVPDPGCRYTAWSSMGTLIRKALVIKEGNPAKYSLTPLGGQLAERLQAHGVETETTGGGRNTTPPQLPDLPEFCPAVLTTTTPGLTESTITSVNENRFCYCYVTEEDTTTRDKNRAVVSVDDTIGIGFLIKCNYQELLKSGKLYKLDISRPLGDGEIFAYLKDLDADDLAPQPPQPKLTAIKPRNGVINPDTLSKLQPTKGRVADLHPTPVSVSNLPASSLSERLGICVRKSVPETSLPSTSITSTSPLFSFQPGSFDILLCVDNQEFYGKTSSGGKTLFADLIKNGISCDLRKLQVGDFLWVAREKVGPVSAGQLRPGEARELVLDHIIERKRMDDLVSSCIDGRFKEQKFRLKQCGLRCPIYLIEDYGSSQNFSMPEERLKQTIANTQVVDGFMVKRTRDNQESVAYLTIMTRYLQSFYQGKTLHCYSADVLSDIAGQLDIHAPEQKLLEFKQFNEASVKTKNLSIREMFGKQIIQMYRLSAEGARAVLEHYPTPAHLCSAYDACRSEKEKEELLSKVKSGKAGRSLGAVASRQFYQLYCTNHPLT